MKVIIRNTAIRLSGVILLAFFIFAAYSTLTVNAASIKTQDVISKITEIRQEEMLYDTQENVFVTKIKYKNGLISNYGGTKYHINKKGKYTSVNFGSGNDKIKYSKGRAAEYSGRTQDYTFYNKYFYNSKGLCNKREFEDAIGGTDHFYYDKKGRIKRIKRMDGSTVDYIEKFTYDKKGNICKIKENYGSGSWTTEKIKNTYSGGKLIERSYTTDYGKITIKYTYKKIKTPAKYKKKIKRQQAWIRNNDVASYIPPLFTLK